MRFLNAILVFLATVSTSLAAPATAATDDCCNQAVFAVCYFGCSISCRNSDQGCYLDCADRCCKLLTASKSCGHSANFVYQAQKEWSAKLRGFGEMGALWRVSAKSLEWVLIWWIKVLSGWYWELVCIWSFLLVKDTVFTFVKEYNSVLVDLHMIPTLYTW